MRKILMGVANSSLLQIEITFREIFALDKPIFGSAPKFSQNPTPFQKIPKVWQNLEEHRNRTNVRHPLEK